MPIAECVQNRSGRSFMILPWSAAPAASKSSGEAQVVLESLQAPRQVAATARRYGVSCLLLLRWRRFVSPGAAGCRWATCGLCISEGGAGPWDAAWSWRVGRQRGDRDRVCGRGSDADRRRGRRRDTSTSIWGRKRGRPGPMRAALSRNSASLRRRLPAQNLGFNAVDPSETDKASA